MGGNQAIFATTQSTSPNSMEALMRLSDTNHVPPKHSLQWHNMREHKVKDLLYGKEKSPTILAPSIGKLLKKKLRFFLFRLFM